MAYGQSNYKIEDIKSVANYYLIYTKQIKIG